MGRCLKVLKTSQVHPKRSAAPVFRRTERAMLQPRPYAGLSLAQALARGRGASAMRR